MPTSEPSSIGGRFSVDLSRPLPDAGGGIPAWAATDRGGTRAAMALRVAREVPARGRAIQTLLGPAGRGIEHVCLPVAHGRGSAVDGAPGWFVVCDAPPGPPLSAALRPWTEPALFDRVVRPLAAALDALHGRGITHRAIRPDNVFQGSPDSPCVLGAAWAAPPALHQPAVFETVPSALCHPAGRGDGHPADDIYALGVLLLTLALGRIPLAGLDAQAVVHRKAAHGDAAAMTEDARLPPRLASLIRGMLTDEPEHRPTAALLRDPVQAAGRRLATRPRMRPGRPFALGPAPIWTVRALVVAMAVDPLAAVPALRTGAVMTWLRRDLAETAAAARLEELARPYAGARGADVTETALLVMRAIMMLDGGMPLCWPGITLFPDGLGPLLAVSPDHLATGAIPRMVSGAIPGAISAAGLDAGLGAVPAAAAGAIPNARSNAASGAVFGANPRAALGPRVPSGAWFEGASGTASGLDWLIAAEAAGAWASLGADRAGAAAARAEARRQWTMLQVPGPSGGIARLKYALNPDLPCASPSLAGDWVVRPEAVIAALDRLAAGQLDPRAVAPPLIDPEIAALLGARAVRGLEQDIRAAGDEADPETELMNTAQLLRGLQDRYHRAPLPALTAWVVARAGPLTARWHQRAQRAAVEARLRALAEPGFLGPILDLLRDDASQAADARGLSDARIERARLDAMLLGLGAGGETRAALAARLGPEIAAGLGLAVAAVTVILAAIG